MQHIPIEKIISYDGVIELNLGELSLYYNELGLNSFPKENRHDRNWSNAYCQYMPQVQDPVISFSSKSLILTLSPKYICKIRLDGKQDIEINNYQILNNNYPLFCRFEGVKVFSNGKKGIILERIKCLNKQNYSSGELNRMYYNFLDRLQELHSKGIIHNDLKKANDSSQRPNIVISADQLRLIDCENIIFKETCSNWDNLLEEELSEVSDYFYELIDFKCNTLT